MTLENLTDNQRSIFDRIESSPGNFLITGKPGTGKSVLTNALLEFGQKYYVPCAPTGMAALNIQNGRTLHSIFKIPVSHGVIAPDFNSFTTDDRTISHIKYNLKTLIIDEVSMVRADHLDYVDRFIQYCKGNTAPFGGVQIIAVGDFFQLPPVVIREEITQFKEYGYDSPFAFSARCFQSFEVLELTEVLRQKGDPEFIRILQHAREGTVTPKDLVAINERVETCEGIRINLCASNKLADEVNERNLKALSDPIVTFNAAVFGIWPMQGGKTIYPAEERLALKVGAQIMVRLNGADRPPGKNGREYNAITVNGTLGKIVDFNFSADEATAESVKIELRDGRIVTIYKKNWERKVKEKIEGKWSERVVAGFEQVPLSLAWAVTMHKSQGQTFDAVHINPNNVFAAGQLYVALSRCRTLQGVTLESRINARSFKTDPKVLNFFHNVEN